MKTNPNRTHAFTLTELIVVLAALGVLATVFVHAQADPQDAAKRKRMICVNNLKQVGLSFRIWANDNEDKFPMQVAAKDKGSLEAVEAGQTYRHFVVMSNELTTTKILACPTDDRPTAKSFDALKNGNLSYFVGLDADETMPNTILAGDRNITNGVPAKKTILELAGKPAAGWTKELHNEEGNIGLADGSAQQSTTGSLRRQITQATKDRKARIQLPEAPE